MSAPAGDANWAFGGDWVAMVHETLADHTRRLRRIEDLLAEHTQRLNRIETRLDRIETTLERLVSAVERLASPGETGTPGPR